jgi:hypothetical protein
MRFSHYGHLADRNAGGTKHSQIFASFRSPKYRVYTSFPSGKVLGALRFVLKRHEKSWQLSSSDSITLNT